MASDKVITGSVVSPYGKRRDFVLKCWRHDSDSPLRWELRRVFLAAGYEFSTKYFQPDDLVRKVFPRWKSD